jgi:hypothetical protein
VPSDGLQANKERLSDLGVLAAESYEFENLVFASRQRIFISCSEEFGEHGRKYKARRPDFTCQHRQHGAREESGMQSGRQYSSTAHTHQIGSGFVPITLLTLENRYHEYARCSAHLCNDGDLLVFDKSLSRD